MLYDLDYGHDRGVARGGLGAHAPYIILYYILEKVEIWCKVKRRIRR